MFFNNQDSTMKNRESHATTLLIPNDDLVDLIDQRNRHRTSCDVSLLGSPDNTLTSDCGSGSFAQDYALSPKDDDEDDDAERSNKVYWNTPDRVKIEQLKKVVAAEGLDLAVGSILPPSPASPLANRGWLPQARKQLEVGAFAYAVDFFTAARERLGGAVDEREGGRIFPLIDAKVEHSRVRDEMSARLLARAPVILKEMLAGRYGRYSYGVKSIAQDIFLRGL